MTFLDSSTKLSTRSSNESLSLTPSTRFGSLQDSLYKLNPHLLFGKEIPLYAGSKMKILSCEKRLCSWSFSQPKTRETNKSFNSVHNGKKNVLSYEKELTERFLIIRIYFRLRYSGSLFYENDEKEAGWFSRVINIFL